MAEKITVPTLGESVTEATVSKWLKSQGEKVTADEPIVELETDKVNVEVPAPINGVLSIFLGDDFLSVNKSPDKNWEDLKHIIISFINDFYAGGKNCVISQIDSKLDDDSLEEIERKIIKVLDTKIRPAVARDGGDIKFKEFKDGIVKVQLQGSCSGCPSSTLTLKQGVQNLLCHYIPEVKGVEAN